MSNVPPDFMKAVNRACLRAVSRVRYADPFAQGDRTAVMYGAHTADIADEAELSVSKTRRLLLSLYTEGKVLRDDRRGGSTAWWPVGLAHQTSAPVIVPATLPIPKDVRLAHPECHAARPAAPGAPRTAVPTRQHWSEVLGVARDDSFRECTAAYRSQLNEILGDTDANQAESDAALKRLEVAYDAAAKDHDVQVTE